MESIDETLVEIRLCKNKNGIGCGRLLPITEFNKHRHVCKDCQRKYNKKYRETHKSDISIKKKIYNEKHKDKIRAHKKEYKLAHKEEISQSGKKRYNENRQSILSAAKLHRKINKEIIMIKRKLYREKNKTKLAAQKKIYREKNKEKINLQKRQSYERHKDTSKQWNIKNKERVLERQRDRRKNNPLIRMMANLRSRVGAFFTGCSLSKKIQELLGCDRNFLLKYIQSLWKPGMTMENYGYYGWHLDHIIPVATIKDVNDMEQIKKVFHYTNLQPLWAQENFRKSDKII